MRLTMIASLGLAITTTWAAARTAGAGEAPDFDRRVATILILRGLDCHSGPEPKGGLDLSRREAAMRGGDSGEAIVPGRPIANGSTDEVGWKAEEYPVHWNVFHATVLQLLGIDHERLTYSHNGIRRRLTNVQGKVIKALLS